MIDIRIQPDRARDITIVTVLGAADVEAIIGAHSAPDYGTTGRVIWDFRAASLSEMTQERLARIAEMSEKTDHLRRTRAVATVVRGDDARLLLKLYTELSLHQFGRTIPYQVVQTMEEAHDWLDLTAPAEPQADTGCCVDDQSHVG